MEQKKVDALRVVQDPAYAASLTESQWRDLNNDPVWSELVGEFHEMTAPVITLYAAQLGQAAPRTQTPPRAPAARPPAQPTPPANTPQQFDVIGKRVPRLHGLGIVTNLGQYTENMRMNRMLFTRTLRSPHPHAKIKSVNTSKAEALRGVVAVLHRGNLPAEYRDVKLGSGPPDRYLFNEEVFEVGSPIAVVAAESEHIADEAVHLIEVDYDVLPAVLDHIEGMKATTPKQWDNKLDGTTLDITPPKIRGNPDQGFAESDVVVQNVTTRSAEHHAALEPTTVIARWDYASDGRDHVTMVGTFRHAHGARNTFSQALKLNQSQVRTITPGYVGASYGSHRDPTLVEIHAALMSKITGVPVRTMNTRAEDFITRTHRTPVRNESKIGVK